MLLPESSKNCIKLFVIVAFLEAAEAMFLLPHLRLPIPIFGNTVVSKNLQLLKYWKKWGEKKEKIPLRS